MSVSVSVIRFVGIGARARPEEWILQRCRGGTRRRRSGARFVKREEPPAGCCSRGVCRLVSASASRLGMAGLGLFALVRCVECSTGRRRKHPSEPVGEGFHGERAEGLAGDVGWRKSREEERDTRRLRERYND